MTQSDLLPDWITLSPLDFAGEYMALETSPNIQGLHFKSVVVLLWTKSQYSYDPLFRGDPVGQSEQPHRAKSVDLRGGMCFTGSDNIFPTTLRTTMNRCRDNMWQIDAQVSGEICSGRISCWR